MKRSVIAAVAALAALVAAAGGAQGDEANPQYAQFAKRMFAEHLAPKGVSYACFERAYDAAHLARHPQQKVKSMKLLVRAELIPEDPAFNHSFQFELGFRHRKGNFTSAGSCGHAQVSAEMPNPLHLGCGVDCDGGGLTIEMVNADKSIMVRLARVAIWDLSKPDGEDRDSLEGGADDRAFRLDRVKLDACKKMIESYQDEPATM